MPSSVSQCGRVRERPLYLAPLRAIHRVSNNKSAGQFLLFRELPAGAAHIGGESQLQESIWKPRSVSDPTLMGGALVTLSLTTIQSTLDGIHRITLVLPS